MFVKASAATLTLKGPRMAIDGGDSSSYTLKGPDLLFKKEGVKHGEMRINPTFTPAADGLSGTIVYKGGPDNAKVYYKISPADKTVTFTYGELLATPPATPLSISFEINFNAGQFAGGLYVAGSGSPTPIPIVAMDKGAFLHGNSFSLAGHDGVGLTLNPSGGNMTFTDDRKYGGDSITWRLNYPLKPAEKSITLKIDDFKTTPPPVVLKPDGPPADGKWEVIPELTDEFQGSSLDTNKWTTTYGPEWLGRPPSWFNPGSVQVKDGKLQLIAKLEEPPANLKSKGFHTFAVGVAVAKTKVLYGYFEAKAKPMDVGICNAFWFTNVCLTDDKSNLSEIDVFEICGGRGKNERTLFNTMHHWKSPGDDKHWAKFTHWRAPAPLTADYHVYGIDWGKDEIKCYYDGYLYAKYPNTAWHTPLNMLFDNEVNPQWFGTPKITDGFPATFNIEYVRAWRRVD